MMTKEMEKKRLWIFIAAAYGVTALMSIFMFIGLRGKIDLTNFVNVQMMYPACGVILGKILVKKEGEKLPMVGYITILVTTLLMMIPAILSVFIKLPAITVTPAQSLDLWNLISQIPLLFGAIIAYIAFWVCGREKADNAGIRRKNIKTSILMIVLFVVLYFVRGILAIVVGDALNGNNEGWTQFASGFTNPVMYLTLISLPFNFFFSWIAFFGEEYGWRYYLQPLMQKKFGLRLGVVLLGLVWGIWHTDVDFMFYSVKDGPRMLIAQLITCTMYAIFFGYVYMKTENIWVPTIIHYINNNLAVVLSGGDVSALQNQSVAWKDLPVHFVIGLIFMLFILAPVYSGKSKGAITDTAENGDKDGIV